MKKNNMVAFDFAPFLIGLDSETRIVEVNNKDFNADKYSELKHGSISSVKHFARTLADEVFQELCHWLDSGYEYDELAISPLPCKEVVTAAFQLTREFVFRFNILLDQKRMNSAVFLPFYKFEASTGYGSLYPQMNQNQREKVLESLQFSVDFNRLKRIKRLILIDDIYVTGANARKVKSYLDEGNFQGEAKFVFLAKVEDSFAKSYPEIESILNNQLIKSPFDFLTLIRKNDFEWNVRVLKQIFELPLLEFKKFIECTVISLGDDIFLMELYYLSLSMNIQGDDRFKLQFDFLRSRVKK
ncbi:MAG: phosphoribosyltransferase family protein [Patescibacteria group bacterium]